jgi:hypothetical protein
VSLPATAAIERLATRLSRTAADPRDRLALERLATAARAALAEGRPASLATRLDVLTDALEEPQLALLAALSDDLPALRSGAGATLERIASLAQLRRARSFLEAL